jgi:hypothetical protein
MSTIFPQLFSLKTRYPFYLGMWAAAGIDTGNKKMRILLMDIFIISAPHPHVKHYMGFTP